MKILILGNIGSGKTTLGKVAKEITGLPFVELDKLREEVKLDGRVSLNYLALYYFMQKAENRENIILECTGSGVHKYSVKRALEISSNSVEIIVCKNRDIKTNLKRLERKNFNYIFPFPKDLKKHIYDVQEELEKDLENKFWSWGKSRVREVFMDTEEDLRKNREIFFDLKLPGEF